MSVFGEAFHRRMVGGREWSGDGEGRDMKGRMERIIAHGREGICREEYRG